MKTHVSRRDVLKAGVAAGVAIEVSFLSSAQAQLIETPPLPGPDWLKADGRPKYRLDAIAKVTGEKTFSRDYRARDLEGWPKEQSHAFLLHATKADRIFEGVDLSLLGDDLKPDKLILHEDLAADGIVTPVPGGFYGDVFLVPKGQTARLLGQPVALLIYRDFARYDAAKRLLRFNDKVVRYGAQAPYSHPAHYGAARYVRIDGGNPDAEDRYSPFKDTVIFAGFNGDAPAWPKPGDGDAMARGMAAADEIKKDIDSAGPDTLVLKHEYFSQSVDASAMEPDNGNVWYEASTGTLHAMIATQSPYEVAEVAATLVSKSKFPLKKVDLKVGYTVGYGTKDHSIFPFFCVVAALYGDGRPVRLANDRYEQFQMALKRHAFWMDNALVIDRKTGKFRAMTGHFKIDGGGRMNFSPSVAFVGATAAQSIYYLPKSDFSAAALASRAVDAGSTRGYGTLQSMSATEMMIDEAAELLGIDAIELRLRNVFKSGMKNTQGAIPAGALRNEEILAKARQHPLWTEKAKKKAAYEAANPGKKYGVGYGHVQKDYGTGAEAALATVEFDAKGKLTFAHVAHEIGTGTTTSQAIMVRDILGKVPDKTEYGKVEWPQMPLETTDEPYTMSQADEDKRKQNPRWTPTFTSPMSATNSVYYLGHATREAARALLDLAIWPAARSLWSRGIGGGVIAPFSVRREELRLDRGVINAGGMPPLTFEQVAAEAHRLGLVTGVTVHTFNRWQWAEAEFDIAGNRHKMPIDALALKYGDGASADNKALMTLSGWQFVERASIDYPPTQRNNAGVTYYAPMATLAELVIDTGTGDVTLLSHHSIMECGTQVVPELVSGQIQGGIAMGIGHALKEYLPLYEDGPGNGTWNWNRYELPHSADVAVWSQTSEILAPLSSSDPPKGIAEVVMIAIVPAIANGIAHAIGKRFYDLPITSDKIRGALS
ncbi:MULTISPECIES: molybdopterin cofactor-binding domain-containing protein [unclassified Beijerinckia]|uniref:xanthine dehydrogenase family protein molybdopterin-binding subunit n=1 Tax=unclassified Beijerinckia TaxID=2638183 RepID=UPI0008993063|nr:MULTISPECIES: molybdopterin cofactor-binding domain-containing protein [unclassified Beijerinckia]MDH7795433.1 CO/xanthine dehydrogenase Mo-binding subunit [Beijerinckia sp. GAS462]SEC01387.1 CO or xanthine dehydrogenase, Mo-binding subunit [Beijerinckia sp. 28-YEA-48]